MTPVLAGDRDTDPRAGDKQRDTSGSTDQQAPRSLRQWRTHASAQDQGAGTDGGDGGDQDPAQGRRRQGVAERPWNEPRAEQSGATPNQGAARKQWGGVRVCRGVRSGVVHVAEGIDRCASRLRGRWMNVAGLR